MKCHDTQHVTTWEKTFGIENDLDILQTCLRDLNDRHQCIGYHSKTALKGNIEWTKGPFINYVGSLRGRGVRKSPIFAYYA